MVPNLTAAAAGRSHGHDPVGQDGCAQGSAENWSYQVVMQTTKASPRRPLPDTQGQRVRRPAPFRRRQRRDCDPHVMDMLALPGMGGSDEADLQHKLMAAWVSGRMNPAGYVYVKLPMVY